MIEEERSLFPLYMQPPINPEMFIRQEALYIGTRLNYESATLSLKTTHPTADDLKVIHNLNRLDHYIIRSADYDIAILENNRENNATFLSRCGYLSVCVVNETCLTRKTAL